MGKQFAALYRNWLSQKETWKQGTIYVKNGVNKVKTGTKIYLVNKKSNLLFR